MPYLKNSSVIQAFYAYGSASTKLLKFAEFYDGDTQCYNGTLVSVTYRVD